MEEGPRRREEGARTRRREGGGVHAGVACGAKSSHRIPLVTNLHIDSVGVERVINAFAEALRDTEEQKTKKQRTSAENH